VAATRDLDALRARVAEVPYWFHSIDLGDGVVTPGKKDSGWLTAELARLRLGDLTGKSVLDIGAWDGYYSFAAERAGAQRVVAFDDFMWMTDLPGWTAYREERTAAGKPVEPAETLAQFWRPDELPGRRGFDLAREALGSKVEPVVGGLFDFDLDELGEFDVVLYLGVLYHVRHPLLALEHLRKLTRELAIVETQADVFRGSERMALCRFIEGDELNNDPSNWWTFNEAALLAMGRAAGFARAEIAPLPAHWKQRAVALARGSAPYRAVMHLYA
jgi:tRNA (mo5U34)-methyltransferase